jgi:hypothetical protein
VHVLIYRMKQGAKRENVTAVGIHADSAYSLSILPDIIRVMFRARDGDRE